MKRNILRLLCTAWVAVFALAGCKTTDEAKQGYLASVVITGHSEEVIRRTTTEVFEWNGYKHLTNLAFEKQGTKWDTAKYGGLSGNPVWVKMRVTINRQAEINFVVGCDAYVVEDRDVIFMEEERKLQFGKRDDCKKILNQIKQRLSLPAPKPQ